MASQARLRAYLANRDQSMETPPEVSLECHLLTARNIQKLGKGRKFDGRDNYGRANNFLELLQKSRQEETGMFLFKVGSQSTKSVPSS